MFKRRILAALSKLLATLLIGCASLATHRFVGFVQLWITVKANTG
jgi:hypothetical protein